MRAKMGWEQRDKTGQQRQRDCEEEKTERWTEVTENK